MKINNKSFNDWLEKEKGINWWKTGYKYRVAFIRPDEIIGLMISWLLDYQEFTISRNCNRYRVNVNGKENENYTDLFEALKTSIESIKE